MMLRRLLLSSILLGVSFGVEKVFLRAANRNQMENCSSKQDSWLWKTTISDVWSDVSCNFFCLSNPDCHSTAYSDSLRECSLFSGCVGGQMTPLCDAGEAVYEERDYCATLQATAVPTALPGPTVASPPGFATLEPPQQSSTLGSVTGQPEQVYDSCSKALEGNDYVSGVYTISLSGEQVKLPCQLDTYVWVVIQRRLDGSVNFNRGWNDYRDGFGDLTREFWLGLEVIHQLTATMAAELKIVLEDWQGQVREVTYQSFVLYDESTGYIMQVANPSSADLDVGDSFTYHRGQRFYTRDSDNAYACAERYGGGWWYNSCHESNLNGFYYLENPLQSPNGTGIHWSSWKGMEYSLKAVEMKIRF